MDRSKGSSRRLSVNLLCSEKTKFSKKGECEAIALAVEVRLDLVIIDDEQARRSASYLRLKVVGTVGLIFSGKENGLL